MHRSFGHRVRNGGHPTPAPSPSLGLGHRPLRRVFELGLCIIAMTPTLVAAAASYDIVDLGQMPGNLSSSGYAINDFGQVAGIESTNETPHFGITHVFLWTPAAPNGTVGSKVDLGPIFEGGPHLNDRGQVTLSIYNNGTQSYLWSPVSPNVNSGSLSFVTPGSVYGINNLGQIAGGGLPRPSQYSSSFVWTPDTMNGTSGQPNHFAVGGGFFEVGYFNLLGTAAAINDAGQVAGTASYGPYFYPFIHNNGTVHFPVVNQPLDFGTIGVADLLAPTPAINDQTGTGGFEAINASGHAVGKRLFGGGYLPTWWDGSTFHVVGSDVGSAHAINSSDDIVGDNVPSAGGLHFGFLFSHDTLSHLETLVDPALGWRITEAWGINDRGQIVGGGFHNGVFSAFVMTPKSAAVSAQLQWRPAGAARYSFAQRRWFQSGSLVNIGNSPVTGPVSLVFGGLNPALSFDQATGSTVAALPAGRPYLDLAGPIPALGSVPLNLSFTAASLVPLNYSTQVLAGPGTR